MQVSTALFQCSLSLSLVFATAASAQTSRQIDRAEYVISPDRSYVYTSHREITPLTQSALQAVAQMRFTVNGNQTFELVEAYTRKSDGRQIVVDQADVVSQDGVVGPLLS